MNVFESYVKKRLLAFKVSARSLDVSGGAITIRDAHLDEALMEEILLKYTGEVLPAACEMLHVKMLHVKIPWNLLGNGGIFELEVDGLNMLLRPRKDAEVTATQVRDIKERHIRTLMQQLQSSWQEARDEDKAGEEMFGGTSGAIFKRLIRRLLRNFRPHISVKNIHVRYESLASDEAVLPPRLELFS